MAGFLLAKAHHMFHDRANAVIGDERLTIKHFGCLTVIADEGRISQQYLGERLRVDRTTIVAIVDDLERRDLVVRRRNPADRRAYALEATDAGRRWLDGTHDRLMAAQDELLGALSPSERRQLVGLLQRLLMGEAAELVADPAVEVRPG
jgi:DNA-binding MarR family transcriptional regulator